MAAVTATVASEFGEKAAGSAEHTIFDAGRVAGTGAGELTAFDPYVPLKNML